MNNLIDQIDAYLEGTMNAADRAAFETKMNADASLSEQVNTQENLRAGIDRLGMKAATAQTFKKVTLKNKLYKWGVATVAVAAIATSAYLINNSVSSSTDGPEITYELHDTNEEGGANWSDADRNLPTQLFTIDPAKDTVIETMGGIVFAIPAGAFINAGDPFTLEIREALTPMDIMKGGLSTTSNGELLETGGMFYINARNGETSLAINTEKPLYANVPTNEIRPGMQLFEGERTADGGINWVNPKPMEKQLIPVDIFSLNFYPDGFLEKVAELGFDANDRKVTDSIYYSYAGRQSLPMGGAAPSDGVAYSKRAKPPYNNDSTLYFVDQVAYTVPDGEAIFKANCSSCHTNTEKRGTGPGLKGVLSRIPGGNWKYDYVHNSSAVIKSGDPYAIKLFQEYKTTMTAFPAMNNAEIDAVLAYADHGGKPYGLEIDPARIRAIVDEKFQNTILATKEFEERLQVIFDLGMPEILDLYVNNLDKKLYEIDSMAMNMIEGNQFREFYTRHDGGVAIDHSHMKELQEYYQKKQEAVRIASQQTFDNRTAAQRKQDSLHFAQLSEQINKNSVQAAENFTDEYSTNLKEAYRQLGLPVYPPAPPADYYPVTVTTPGWKNVDVYVNESTTNRTTLDYTDPLSGKKAVIKYEELKVNIADASTYTQLMVYLVADSLPCFMKLYPLDGAYSEKLNELMEYSLVVIAEKDGTWFSATTPKVTPGTVNVTMQKTEEATLRTSLNSMFTSKTGVDFNAEIGYMKETRQFNVRKEKEAEQARIDREIMQIIFPMQPSEPVTTMSCEEALELYLSAALAANEIYEVAYLKAVELRSQAYAQADEVEKSFKNPLEKTTKKAAADAMRKSADQAYDQVISMASDNNDKAMESAKKQLDASCGKDYLMGMAH